MRSLYFSVLAIISIHTSLHAQIISSMNPQVGDVGVLSIEFSITDPGVAGNGVVWDFGQASFLGENAVNVVPLSEASSAELFPNATLAFSGSFLGGDEMFYSFFDFSTGDWSEYGQVTTDVGDVYATVFSDPRTYFTTPLTTASSGNDTYAAVLDLGFLSATITGTATWTVDGSGTLILPNATYTDVIRVRNEALEVLTPDGIPFGIESTIITHMWLKDGVPFPLLQAVTTIEDFGGEIEEDFYASALISYSTGTSSVSDQSALNDLWSAMPNPFQDQLRLVPANEIQGQADITLLDLNGRLIKALGSFNISGTSEVVLNLNDVLPGFYLISIDHAEGRSFQKVVKAAH